MMRLSSLTASRRRRHARPSVVLRYATCGLATKATVLGPLFVVFLLPATVRAESKLEQFFAQNCVKCHGSEKQKGEVQLDKPVDALFADEELLETIATVLEAGEMPPEEAPQPEAKAVADVVQILQEQILLQRPVNPLKRLTRAEYTNTMRDLFGVDFDFAGLLPPDHVEHGFDKFGEAHLMSPHQGNGLPQDRTLHRRAGVAGCQTQDEDVGI